MAHEHNTPLQYVLSRAVYKMGFRERAQSRCHFPVWPLPRALPPPAPAALLLASQESWRAHAARHLHATGDATSCPAGGSPARPSPGLPAPWVRLEGVLDYIVDEGSDTYLLVRTLLR